MSKIIHMQTDSVREAARRLQAETDQMLANTASLKRAAGRLSVAWQGRKADEFNHKLNRLVRQFEDSARSMQSLARRVFSEVDEWSSVDQSGADHTKAARRQARSVSRGSAVRDRYTVDGHSEYFLLRGTEADAYKGYLVGDLTFKEAVDFIKKDPFKKHVVQSSITFYKAEASGKLAWQDGELATRYGNFAGSLGSLEAGASSRVMYKDGALRAEAGGQLGAYAARGTYDAELAGFGIAAVGFVGAEAAAQTSLAFDPKKGEVGAKAEFDAFAGGKVEGSVSRKGELAGVEGEVKAKGAISYGIGATGKADLGFSQGHLRAEAQLGATLGLGAEFGVSFDVNVQQAATNIMKTGQDAVNWLFN